MRKEIHLIKGIPGESYKAFSDRMFELAKRILALHPPEKLKITLTTGKPPALSVIPFRKEKVAAFSLTGNPGPVEVLGAAEGFTGAYSVEEAIPVSYGKKWKDWEPTPGVCLLTLFHQKPGIDRDSFLTRWHQSHTPLSLRLHPLWNYNRNVVLESLTDNSLWYDGIVEEQFRTRKDLLNPFRFFGPPLQVPGHMLEVWRDSRSFIDMKRIEPYLAKEYLLKY